MEKIIDDVILKMTDITKVFLGVYALVDVNFELKKGEIHALIGENGAGKSTLVKILLGFHQPDRGSIIYKGKPVEFKNVGDALKNGICMIHQEIRLIHGMTVAENIWLGREDQFSSFGFINKGKRIKKTEELFAGLNININPKKMVCDLSVAEMQLVELARAVSYNSDIIIMDEPTSALTDKEIHILYDIARSLRDKGVSIIFISHKIEEIFEICSRVTVLRDGTYIDTLDVANITKEKIINLVAGRDISSIASQDNEKRTACSDAIKLEVKDLYSPGVYKNINFCVHKGEIIGFYGLMGAGRTEIMRSIFGLDKFVSGKILIDGKPVEIKSPRNAIELGIGMLTEDRLRLGVIPSLSVIANSTISSLKQMCRFAWTFSKKKEMEVFRGVSNELSIKYSSPDELIGQLSGGNQQKVLLGRWLLNTPSILILDEPTRGIDVGAKAEIHRHIKKLASDGMAVVLVSSELPEVISMADRIFVVRNGEIVCECLPEDADQTTIVGHAFGVSGN